MSGLDGLGWPNPEDEPKAKTKPMNRAEQHADLCEMVKLCRSLNNGSGIVFKIHRLEQIAKELTRTDWDKPKCSFIEWVRRKVDENSRHDNTQHGTT